MRICTRTPSPRIARWAVLSPDLHWLLAGERLSHWLAHSPAQGRGCCHQLSHCQAPSAASGGCGSAQGALPPPQTWSRLSADLLRFLLCFPGSPPPPRPPAMCPLTEARRGRRTLKPDGAPTLPPTPLGKLHQKVLRASPPHRETCAVSNEARASGVLKGDIQGLWTLLIARPPPPHHHL